MADVNEIRVLYEMKKDRLIINSIHSSGKWEENIFILQIKTKRHIITDGDLKTVLRHRRIFRSVPACKNK